MWENKRTLLTTTTRETTREDILPSTQKRHGLVVLDDQHFFTLTSSSLNRRSIGAILTWSRRIDSPTHSLTHSMNNLNEQNFDLRRRRRNTKVKEREFLTLHLHKTTNNDKDRSSSGIEIERFLHSKTSPTEIEQQIWKGNEQVPWHSCLVRPLIDILSDKQRKSNATKDRSGVLHIDRHDLRQVSPTTSKQRKLECSR